MPLALIQHIPLTPQKGILEWSFWHAMDHGEIVGGIKRFTGVLLRTYFLDPIPSNIQVWLQAHQQAHNDMNGFLNLPGSDLQDLDWKDPLAVRAFLFLNFNEHQAARLKVGI